MARVRRPSCRRGRARDRHRRDRALPAVPLRLRHVDRIPGRHLLHRDHRAEHRHWLQRPDLARAGRVHGHRRLHDGDPARSTTQRQVDDPGRRPRRRGRRLPVRVPGAPAARRVSRARRRSRSRSPSSSSLQSAIALRRMDGRRSDGVVFGEPSTPYYLTWSIALGAALLALAPPLGQLGRSFRAVRDARCAAVSSGINLALFEDARLRHRRCLRGRRRRSARDPARLVNYLTFPVRSRSCSCRGPRSAASARSAG